MGVALALAVLAHTSNGLAGRNEGGYVGAGRMGGWPNIKATESPSPSEYSGRLLRRVAPRGNLRTKIVFAEELMLGRTELLELAELNSKRQAFSG